MFDTEFLDLPPLSRAGGAVRLPGSKSISNRVLLLAALSHGETTVHDLLASDDTAVMLTALRQLGCTVRQDANTAVIAGLGGRPVQTPAKLFMGNAGTAMRPLTAALALLGGEFELSGVPRMHERPIGDLVDALRQLGCAIDYLGNEGFPPLKLRPGQLKLDEPIKVRGDVSSQFLTALLMALPLVASRDIHIDVVGELISRPYIEITLKLLQRFGIDVQRQGWERFTIPAGSQYQSPGDIHVEGDASSASYFIALGAIATPAGGQKHIEILGVGADSIQGDIRFVEAARMMGAQIESTPNSLRISRGSWPLKAIDLDCNHIPDAAMTLAAMALYADGTTTLRNIASWRVKETDRIAAMACELQKLGATVEEGADYLKVTPPDRWKAAAIHTYDDHRIAMCFSLAAFNPAQLPVRILDPKCVAKTFPDYFETLFEVAEAETAHIPVICIDGPTASGKGTLASQAAHRLGYHYLDSGALYRLSAHAASLAGISLDDGAGVAGVARTMPVRFQGDRIFLGADDVSDAIRTEAAGMAASRVSAHPEVRAALLELQHSFRRLPGLVADGRDMGTVIFPAAPLKIFLTASALHRAERRHKQLISKGNSATIAAIQQDLEARDARDSSRKAAPLKPADDARPLDNSYLSIEESVKQVLDWWQGTRPF
ncbi:MULTISPECIES: bifunctional 3-phosphoshikimate 1-carboxyvinyltransferase/cytidylate kinase [unclassified Polaromonas]|uniref:bifunctional 3-phosphoshikimate 1-carboxyvinyltransferase/cytidylate kinase n=1 Tax=unclassified Polaromonas TaxID=2638319 RepID=UPI000F083555|nr:MULTISPECIES: bifunctional 3-phosphoshikimate 1-carboxyvinyltransferase/cytidylate kinase [unclassified Polaromonas]AYQ26592.1 bifunctional 3-phosphoshikimate 1-carboxyvinyltransferase/cytidylate kinase [Polaromonas sp. SP1]QGJ18562.1 bifunctional 3-phosphoshikimate 1-carboxyvinyltransferase/cytidylate kinase [Polaromonas sp. Pch-P]